MSPVRFLVLMAVTPAVLCGFYIAGFVHQLGAPYAAEYWIADSLVVKREVLVRAEQIPGNKMIIVGGSSGLFGLDSKLLQSIVGIPTFNLALAIHLPIEFYLDLIKPALRPGDLVILAFEYEYYGRGTPYTPDFTYQVLTWNTEYLHRLPIWEQTKLVAAVPWHRVLGGVLTTFWSGQIEDVELRRVTHPEAIRRVIPAMWKGEVKVETDFIYNFSLIDERGNYAGLRDFVYVGLVGPDFSGLVVAPTYPWTVLADFATWCRAHQIKVFVAWPPTLEPPDIDFNSPSARTYVTAIRSRLAALDLPVLGQPEYFQYDRGYFGDVYYHLSVTGRDKHTRRLGLAINSTLAGQEAP